MICISIAQESRRMALVDMLNASKQCDLIEVRLDKFENAPDIPELLTRKPKPIMLSCRRLKDGGMFSGGEEERLALLRQCIVQKADYVEIEVDVADQIRKFPPAKRVITYTNLKETPSNIAEIYAECQTKSPDVIKLVTQARTPEEAWPLLQILHKAPLPTVVVGLGKSGIMLSILAKRLGSPWTYAALEKGLEAYPDQPTVRELNEIYHYPLIERSTKFVAVTGFGESEYATTAVLNAVFAHQGLTLRCLPIGVGSLTLFRKVVDAVKSIGIVVEEEQRAAMTALAAQLDPEAKEANSVDLLLKQDTGWMGYNTFVSAMVGALEATMREKIAGDRPLQGKMVMLAGATPTARAIGQGIAQRGGMVTIASRSKEAGQRLAQDLNCRFVQFEGLYSTMHDVLVIADEEKLSAKSKKPQSEAPLHAGYLRPNMGVLDLTAPGRRTPFMNDAQKRGCLVVSPRRLLRAQLEAQARVLTGTETPGSVFESMLDTVLPEED